MNTNTEIKTRQQRQDEQWPNHPGNTLAPWARLKLADAEISDLRAEIARLQAALAEAQSKIRPRVELSPELREALAEAAKTHATATTLPDGSAVFLNYGDQPEDTTHLDCTACGGSGHIDDQKVLAQRVGCGEPVSATFHHYGLSLEQVQQLLDSGLKPEEIGGADDVQHLRVNELVWWFSRLAQGNANMKWAVPHAYELAYFVATNGINRHIDLQKVKLESFKEGVNITPQERLALERAGIATPPAAVTDADKRDGWLNEDDMSALQRFKECCDDFDSGGHDVSKDRVARLCEIGALQSKGFGRYQITSFGSLVLSAHDDEWRKLPMRTYEEINEDLRLAHESKLAAIAASEQEGR